MSRKQYEQQGFSHTATCLLKALAFRSKSLPVQLCLSACLSTYSPIANAIIVETIFPAMLEISLTKSMSLFATVSLYPLILTYMRVVFS